MVVFVFYVTLIVNSERSTGNRKCANKYVLYLFPSPLTTLSRSYPPLIYVRLVKRKVTNNENEPEKTFNLGHVKQGHTETTTTTTRTKTWWNE